MGWRLELSVQQHLLPVVVVLVMITIGMELRVADFRTLIASPRVPVLGTLIHTLSFPAVAVAVILLIQALDVAVVFAKTWRRLIKD